MRKLFVRENYLSEDLIAVGCIKMPNCSLFSRETLVRECLRREFPLLVPVKICPLSQDLDFSPKLWSAERRGFSRQNILTPRIRLSSCCVTKKSPPYTMHPCAMHHDATGRGSHGLSARRARRTKSRRPEGPQTRSWGPEGP